LLTQKHITTAHFPPQINSQPTNPIPTSNHTKNSQLLRSFSFRVTQNFQSINILNPFNPQKFQEMSHLKLWSISLTLLAIFGQQAEAKCEDQLTSCARVVAFCHHERFEAVYKVSCAKTCGYCKDSGKFGIVILE
jgi:hypothetical protein